MFSKLLKTFTLATFALTLSAVTAFAGVTVSSPAPGATVASPAHFIASASSVNPVTSMTVYVDGTNKYQLYSNHLDTYIALPAGGHSVVVQAWDSTGAVLKSAETINVSGTSTVASASTTGVTISAPANGSSNGSPVHFVASASASRAIGAMRIYVDNNDVFDAGSNHLDTYVSLGGGTHYVVIQAWDVSGAVYKASQTISVGGTATTTSSSSAPSGAKTFTDIDQMGGWENCDSCAALGANGPTNPHTITQGVSNPSMDGKAAQFWIGGNTPYADALWWKQLGGNDGTSHFIYDLYFYVKDNTAQALEFDANQGFGSKRYIMGTECGLNGSKQWDVWNAATGHWMPTGIPCASVPAYTWNHLTEEFARVNGQVQFISITLNGKKSYVNKYSNPQPIPSNVHELNVAVQIDMNSKAQAESMWVDKITLSAW
jgi:hypothetical protein